MNWPRSMYTCSLLSYLAGVILLAGCANYGVIQNQQSADPEGGEAYDVELAHLSERSNEVGLALAFSGGGTRAAALAYGVLLALKDTPIEFADETRRLLDEIDMISSVSGGSFTAAYLKLYGDRIFTEFEPRFLRNDVQAVLRRRLFNPVLWFSRKSRTEMAIEYYDDLLFNQATFGDMLRRAGPLVVINATDLGHGVRFSFSQEYFSLLCSDLTLFSVSRAVAASSAFPVVFPPVVLENYEGCDIGASEFIERTSEHWEESPMMSSVIAGVSTYLEKDKRRYIHLVDGGISDNLGLLSFYEVVGAYGGIKAFLEETGGHVSPHFMMISVNASTNRYSEMDLSNQTPSLSNTITAMSNTQIHRTNAATLELMKDTVERWAVELSTPESPTEPYFVEIAFDGIEDGERRDWYNQIPTGFSLSDEEVDGLIQVGRELLLNHPEFRRFMASVGRD